MNKEKFTTEHLENISLLNDLDRIVLICKNKINESYIDAKTLTNEFKDEFEKSGINRQRVKNLFGILEKFGWLMKVGEFGESFAYKVNNEIKDFHEGFMKTRERIINEKNIVKEGIRKKNIFSHIKIVSAILGGIYSIIQIANFLF